MRNGSKSNFQISSGYGGLGFSYAKERWQFAITVGWPYSSFLNPDVGAPDWSRSISVHWGGPFPLNPFMGGLSLYLSEDRKSVVWGKSVSVSVDLGGRPII